MNRRHFVSVSASSLLLPTLAGGAERVYAARPMAGGGPLKAPENRKINVAFAINQHATMIDFAGPWEVFQDVHVPGRGSSHDDMMPFRLYTVAPTTEVVRVTGGMRVIPDYAVDDAPQPDLIVVPAQQSHPDMLAWLGQAHAGTQLTMSVCTGAFQLGKAGLLDGLAVTTHHDYYDSFQEAFPNTRLERGMRFVEHDRIATAGGLTSGIDLALRVVERYFGRKVAAQTAYYMEYTSETWKV